MPHTTELAMRRAIDSQEHQTCYEERFRGKEYEQGKTRRDGVVIRNKSETTPRRLQLSKLKD